MSFAAVTPLNAGDNPPQLLITTEAWQGTLVFQGAVLDGGGMAMFLPLSQTPVIDELFLAVAPAKSLNGSVTHRFGRMVTGAGAYVSFTSVCPRPDGLEQVLCAGCDAASYAGQWILDKLASQEVVGVLVLDPSSGELLDQQQITIPANERAQFQQLRVQTAGQNPMTTEQLGLAHFRLMERVMGTGAVDIDRRIIGQNVGRNQLCPCASGLKFKRCCGRG